MLEHTLSGDELFMRLASCEAWKYQGLTYPNPAVGCVVQCGDLLVIEAHKEAGSAHAELEALSHAYAKLTRNSKILDLTPKEKHNYLLQNHNNIFAKATIFVTLEPCAHSGKTPSCALLLRELKPKRVVIGTLDPNREASGGVDLLISCGIDVSVGVLEESCEDLLLPFRYYMSGSFVFFKWAQRLNGTYDDGVISSLESRELVHAMRSKCDLLVVGGETVRSDKPTLDARLAGGVAPDLFIYSRGDDFDRSIPLFGIKDRKVMIGSDLSVLKSYKNIMIEGGSSMFEATKDIVDLHLCFVAPTFGGKKSFEANESFRILNSTQASKDTILWLKRGER